METASKTTVDEYFGRGATIAPRRLKSSSLWILTLTAPIASNS
jgi:hypothetical protein